MDGNTDGNFFDYSVTHTNLETNAWWQVDLGASASITSIVVWNRTDACCMDRLSDYWVFVSDTPFQPTDTPSTLQNRAGTWSNHQTSYPNPFTPITAGGAQGRYLRVQLSGTNYLSLAEVQVTGTFGGGPTTVPVTIASLVSGVTSYRAFSVSGTGCNPGSYTTPYALNWTPGSSCTVAFTSPQTGGDGTQYVFGSWSDNGASGPRGNPRTFIAPGSATTYTANVTVAIKGPSLLRVNLSYLPVGSYDTAHFASSDIGLSQSCPTNSTVRACFQTILWNMQRQGVSGVRVYVNFCGADGALDAGGVTQCGHPWNQITFDKTTGPGLAWIQNVSNFFADVKANNIQNVDLSLVHGSSAGGTYSQAKADSTSPADTPGNKVYCADTTDPVLFYATYPFGLKSSNFFPIGQGDNGGYNCSPINPYFVGWQNQFNVIDAVLAAAQSNLVTISELEFEQEQDLVDFTSELRLMYDNSSPESALQQPGTSVDILTKLRGLMNNHNFLAGNVTWSAPWIDATLATENCLNVYQDYSRESTLDAILAAIGGGVIGLNNDHTTSNGLYCGGTTNTMLPSPMYNPTQPSIVDSHMYPHVDAGPGASEDYQITLDPQIPTLAQLDYSDLQHFVAKYFPSAQVIIGETHPGTPYYDTVDKCNPFGNPGGAPNVVGFNASLLAGYYVVFRPWMEVLGPTGKCFPYNGGGATSYQNVNYNWNGPYAPTQQQ
ncbi:MAG: discoidin domain-containing protein [Acidobacteriia bacterium]|nr:discoidin domain-containing protein [Terriglobia bacterium]